MTFNVLSDPVPGAACGKCGGPLFIVARWSADSFYLHCDRCRTATLHKLEFGPPASPAPSEETNNDRD